MVKRIFDKYIRSLCILKNTFTSVVIKKIYIVKISGITAIYYRINLCSHQPHRSINNNYSAHVKAIWWVNSGL